MLTVSKRFTISKSSITYSQPVVLAFDDIHSLDVCDHTQLEVTIRYTKQT